MRVEARGDWRSMFALAMTAAAGMWGGYGFIYLPHGTGKLHQAPARVLRAYDPDYLVDALWTYGDMEAISSGWHSTRVKDWPEGEEARARLAFFQDDVVPWDRRDDLGAELCSPYKGPGEYRPLEALGGDSEYLIPRLSTVLGAPPMSDLPIPEGLDPSLTLALGFRAGYPSKPSLPIGREAGTDPDRLPSRYVRFALSSRNGLPHEFGGLKSAWDLTRTGLTPIRKPWPPARPVAVVGSSAEDFALAVALDRMFGSAIWVPAEWADDPAVRAQVQLGYYGLAVAARGFGTTPVVTSISLSDDQLTEAVRTGWPRHVSTPDDQGNSLALAGVVPPEIVPAEQLDLMTGASGSDAGLDCDDPIAEIS